jgi:hypothetical protein
MEPIVLVCRFRGLSGRHSAQETTNNVGEVESSMLSIIIECFGHLLRGDCAAADPYGRKGLL